MRERLIPPAMPAGTTHFRLSLALRQTQIVTQQAYANDLTHRQSLGWAVSPLQVQAVAQMQKGIRMEQARNRRFVPV
jgi:hypothetical protein